MVDGPGEEVDRLAESDVGLGGVELGDEDRADEAGAELLGQQGLGKGTACAEQIGFFYCVTRAWIYIRSVLRLRATRRVVLELPSAKGVLLTRGSRTVGFVQSWTSGKKVESRKRQ